MAPSAVEKIDFAASRRTVQFFLRPTHGRIFALPGAGLRLVAVVAVVMTMLVPTVMMAAPVMASVAAV